MPFNPQQRNYRGLHKTRHLHNLLLAREGKCFIHKLWIFFLNMDFCSGEKAMMQYSAVQGAYRQRQSREPGWLTSVQFLNLFCEVKKLRKKNVLVTALNEAFSRQVCHSVLLFSFDLVCKSFLRKPWWKTVFEWLGLDANDQNLVTESFRRDFRLFLQSNTYTQVSFLSRRNETEIYIESRGLMG